MVLNSGSMLRILRQWIIDHFGFTKSEANGTLILIIIVVITFIVPKVYLIHTTGKSKSFTVDQEKMEQWTKQLEASIKPKEKTHEVAERSVQRFLFDPNKASESELISLGFADKVASNIVAYRNSGGHFKIKNDLKRIYGISQDHLSEIWDLIELPNEYQWTETDKPTLDHPRKKEPEPKEEIVAFDINKANAEQLQDIRGIGPVLSERIIKFRDLLGGFHSTSQYQEVYGLDTAVINALKAKSFISSGLPHQLNLNKDSLQQLYQHPYIDYKLARAIYNYRLQRGQLDSVAQIKSIKILSDSLYEKIYPYLSLNP